MLICYSTQKLLTKLSVEANGLLPEGNRLLESMDLILEDNPLSHWHGNLFTIGRRQCVLMVHSATRFPVLLVGLTKKDFAIFDHLFSDALMNTLLKVGADEDQMQAAEQLLAPLSFVAATNDKINGRSVKGTSNQMKGDFEHMLAYENIDVMNISTYRTAAWLADRPCSVKCKGEGAAKSKKDVIRPVKSMLALLDSIDVDYDIDDENDELDCSSSQVIHIL
jgi:hypothetical protein